MRILLLLLFTTTCYSDDTPPPKSPPAIRFPKPTTTSITPAAPVDYIELYQSQMIVIESDIPFIVVPGMPSDPITISETQEGPVTIRAIFAPTTTTTTTTRKYTSKYVIFVELNDAPDTDKTINVIAIPNNAKSKDDLKRQVIRIIGKIPPNPNPPNPNPPNPNPPNPNPPNPNPPNPNPPNPNPPNPNPPTPNPPTPTPTPTPTPVTGDLRVIMLWDAKANNTKEQLNVLNSVKLLDYLNKNAKEWRKWDKDTKLTNTESKEMTEIWRNTQPQIKTLPAIVVIRGTQGEIKPLPKTPDEAIKLLAM